MFNHQRIRLFCEPTRISGLADHRPLMAGSKHLKEGVSHVGVILQSWWQLPQPWAEFGAQALNPRKKSIKKHLRRDEPPLVRDGFRQLNCKAEVFGYVRGPPIQGLVARQSVEGRVDLRPRETRRIALQT